MINLHLGCGRRDFGSDWVHIDGGEYAHLDYNDITKLLYHDNTVDLIYASHVIEYFDSVEIVHVLNEWYRVLRVGGTLRLAVPDFEKLMRVYQNTGDIKNILGPLFGKMPMGDKMIFHKTVYDFKSLRSLLNSIGFKDVRLYEWRVTDHAQYDDHSQAYFPHMDKDNGILISLNVEAIK